MISNIAYHCGGLVFALFAVAAHSEALPTPLERAKYSRISTSAEVSKYLEQLTVKFPQRAHNESLGESVAGRPLELLRIHSPKQPAGSGHLKVMIVGTQHGGAEPASGEALLVIARELLSGDFQSMLDELDLYLIPNANPDGRDLKRRANANGVNLNTDYVLLSQPETQALNAAIIQYRPDVVLDSHESAVLKLKSLAREGYLTDFNAQFEVGNNPGIPSVMRAFALREFLPQLLQRAADDGLPAQRYIGEITSIKQPITNGGLTLRNFRNTAAITGSLALLVETKLDSKKGTYPTYRNLKVRVERQLSCLHTFLKLVIEQRDAIKTSVAVAHDDLIRESLTLDGEYTAATPAATVDIPLRHLASGQLESVKFTDRRQVATAAEIHYPPMLVITRHTAQLRDVLEKHRINTWSLDHSTSAEVIVERYQRRDAFKAPLQVAEIKKTIEIAAGSLFVDLAQPGGRAAALLLNPRSNSSVFRYPAFAKFVVPGEDFFIYRTFKGATRLTP